MEPRAGDISQFWSAQIRDWNHGVDLALIKTVYAVTRYVAKPFVVEFEELSDHVFIRQPTMSLHMGEAKQLMQALWDAGLRPENGGHGSSAQVESMKAHIKFAESIVDKLYAIADTQKAFREMNERFHQERGT